MVTGPSNVEERRTAVQVDQPVSNMHDSAPADVGSGGRGMGMLESGLRTILEGLRPELLERAKYVIDHFADIKQWDDYMSARGFTDQTRRTYRYWLLRFISETLLPVALVS